MPNANSELGLVHVYTGNGKGKTTAALGLCLRAIGQGLKCCFIQVMKGQDCGEWNIREALFNFDMYRFGTCNFVTEPTEVDRFWADKAVEKFEEAVVSGEYDLVVFDEVCVATYYKLIDPVKVIEILKKRGNTEVVLTGRYAPEEFIEFADYVTSMEEIKHPYQKGILERRGIEY